MSESNARQTALEAVQSQDSIAEAAEEILAKLADNERYQPSYEEAAILDRAGFVEGSSARSSRISRVKGIRRLQAAALTAKEREKLEREIPGEQKSFDIEEARIQREMAALQKELDKLHQNGLAEKKQKLSDAKAAIERLRRYDKPSPTEAGCLWPQHVQERFKRRLAIYRTENDAFKKLADWSMKTAGKITDRYAGKPTAEKQQAMEEHHQEGRRRRAELIDADPELNEIRNLYVS